MPRPKKDKDVIAETEEKLETPATRPDLKTSDEDLAAQLAQARKAYGELQDANKAVAKIRGEYSASIKAMKRSGVPEIKAKAVVKSLHEEDPRHILDGVAVEARLLELAGVGAIQLSLPNLSSPDPQTAANATTPADSASDNEPHITAGIAKQQGIQAAKDTQPLDSNPYAEGKIKDITEEVRGTLSHAWVQGWKFWMNQKAGADGLSEAVPETKAARNKAKAAKAAPPPATAAPATDGASAGMA